MESPLLKKFDLDFAQIEIYESFVVATIKEGVLFDKKHLIKFFELCFKYFPNKCFGYISNRKYDYTVDPTCYLEPSINNNLSGIAITCYNEASERTANFEKKFYNKPMEIFSSMEKSEKWLKELIYKNKKAGL